MPIISNLSHKPIDLSGRLYATFVYRSHLSSRIKKPASVSQDIKKNFFCAPIPNNSLSEIEPFIFILPVRLQGKTFCYDSEDGTALNNLTSLFVQDDASREIRVRAMNNIIVGSLCGTSFSETQIFCVLEDEKNFNQFITNGITTFSIDYQEHCIKGMKTHAFIHMIKSTFIIYSALKNVAPLQKNEVINRTDIHKLLRSVSAQLPRWISENLSIDLYFEDSWPSKTIKHFSVHKTIDKQTFLEICGEGTKFYEKHLTKNYLDRSHFPMTPSKIISEENYAELQPGIEAMRQFVLNRKVSKPHQYSKKTFFGDFDKSIETFYTFCDKFYHKKIAEDLKNKANEKLNSTGFRTPSPPPPDENEEIIDLEID